MRFRTLETIPVLFIIAATLLLGGLGVWQLERLKWKNALLASIAVAQEQEPLTALPKDMGEALYRRVTVSGTFLNDKYFYRVTGSRAGQPGFMVLTPLRLKDKRIILVARGWTPSGEESRPLGLQTIKGIIRPPRERRPFVPDNRADKNLWFYEDIEAMSKHSGLTLLPAVIEQVGTYQKDTYPIPGDGKIILRNNHLGYALTWFSLAIAGLVMFVLYYCKKD